MCIRDSIRGFTVVWKHQEYLRVDTRNYIIRITAVSQEHALVSITHTSRKLREFSVGIKIDLVFVWVVEIDAILEWGIGVDLISVQG